MKTFAMYTFKDNPKQLFSFVKNTGQEANGVFPLKNEDGFLKSDSTCKANIRNDLFVYVFTKIDTSSFPDKGPSMANKEVKLERNSQPTQGVKTIKDHETRLYPSVYY